MPTTVRFGDKTEERLRRAARRRGVTKSEFIRELVEAELNRENRQATSWELAKDLCGAFSSGDPRASQRDAGEIVREKHRRIRERYGRRAG